MYLFIYLFGHDIITQYFSPAMTLGPSGRDFSSQAKALATGGLWRRGGLEEVLDARLKDLVDMYKYSIT
jgi:hypothetical protein